MNCFSGNHPLRQVSLWTNMDQPSETPSSPFREHSLLLLDFGSPLSPAILAGFPPQTSIVDLGQGTPAATPLATTSPPPNQTPSLLGHNLPTEALERAAAGTITQESDSGNIFWLLDWFVSFLLNGILGLSFSSTQSL